MYELGQTKLYLCFRFPTYYFGPYPKHFIPEKKK